MNRRDFNKNDYKGPTPFVLGNAKTDEPRVEVKLSVGFCKTLASWILEFDDIENKAIVAFAEQIRHAANDLRNREKSPK